VVAILEAAPSLPDKLVLGLMYAIGMRVGEGVRVRWRDIGFDRNTMNIGQGKGRSDRQVMLPNCYRSLLRELSVVSKVTHFYFRANRRGVTSARERPSGSWSEQFALQALANLPRQILCATYLLPTVLKTGAKSSCGNTWETREFAGCSRRLNVLTGRDVSGIIQWGQNCLIRSAR
jgi:hypothetical protein